jgi:hypothetical protein
VSRKNFVDVGRMTGDGGGPAAETAMSVHCADPFGQEFALRLLLLVVLTLHLQNQGFPIRQSNVGIPLNEYDFIAIVVAELYGEFARFERIGWPDAADSFTER